jgi:hypothetical protein
MTRLSLFVPVLVVAVLISVLAWAGDYVTLQGERTVYTVECKQGTWNGDRCTGKLAAADRYRFRALRVHREVLFWIVGSTEPSGRFTQCDIKDGRNWVCKPNADSPRAITLAMARGRPVPDPAADTRAFHAVSKVRWLLLKYEIAFGNTADTP